MDQARRLGTYKFSMMYLAYSSEDERVYKAGYKNLGNMLILAAILLLPAYFGYQWAKGLDKPKEASPTVAKQREEFQQRKAKIEAELKKMMSEEEWAEWQEKQKAKDAQRRKEQETRLRKVTKPVQTVVYILCGVAVIVAIMGPLSCLWGRLAIRITPQRKIEIFERGTFFSTRRSWPIADFQEVQVAIAGVQRGRTGSSVWAGWHWTVRLFGPQGDVELIPEVERQKTHSARLPQRVSELLEWLRHATGLPVRGADSTG